MARIPLTVRAASVAATTEPAARPPGVVPGCWPRCAGLLDLLGDPERSDGMPSSVRVVSWNLMNPGHGRAEQRLDAAVRVLAQLNADVVCVQESWTRAREHLARSLGMTVAAQGEGDSACAVLTRLEVLERDVHCLLPHDPDRSRFASALLAGPSGRPWLASSTHLAWGGAAEGHRLAQAVAIDEHVDRVLQDAPEAVCVLGGDFNALPESATVRFLTGLDPIGSESTLWIDAWAAVGQGPGFTSDPANPHASETAAIVGIRDASLLPARRIDYVLVRGWAYGRPGSPLSAHLAGLTSNPVTPSDHYAVVTDLWDPLDR